MRFIFSEHFLAALSRGFVIENYRLVALNGKQIDYALNENLALRLFVADILCRKPRDERLFAINFIAVKPGENSAVHDFLKSVFIEQFRLFRQKNTLRKLPYKFVINAFCVKIEILEKLMVSRSAFVCLAFPDGDFAFFIAVRSVAGKRIPGGFGIVVKIVIKIVVIILVKVVAVHAENNGLCFGHFFRNTRYGAFDGQNGVRLERIAERNAFGYFFLKRFSRLAHENIPRFARPTEGFYVRFVVDYDGHIARRKIVREFPRERGGRFVSFGREFRARHEVKFALRARHRHV